MAFCNVADHLTASNGCRQVQDLAQVSSREILPLLAGYTSAAAAAAASCTCSLQAAGAGPQGDCHWALLRGSCI